MQQTLDDTTVIVTRPRHQADEFVRLIEAAGGKAIRLPVIDIQPLGWEPAELNPSDKLIFISANAVSAASPALKARCGDTLDKISVIAIGQATARALQQQGLNVSLIPPPPFNTEALLAMPEMQQIAGQHYTIIKGREGRELLAEELVHRGAKVKTCDVYQRVAAKPDTEVLEHLDSSHRLIVAITSLEGLHNFFNIITSEQHQRIKQHAQLLVPGERIAEQARQMGMQHPIIQANNPGDQSMLEAIVHSK